jgi:mannose-1-phosphate guanylyltransferase
MPLPDGETLLQKTALRASSLPGVSALLTVTNREYYFRSKDEYAHLEGRLARQRPFLLEPFGRNTAPAVAMGALYAAAHHGEDCLLLVLPADHLIQDAAAFAAAVDKASQAARKGYLVTFGIVPRLPETAFGYIACGDELAEAPARRVLHFVEKPSRMRAEEYLAAGNFFWNSGMFCFTAKTLLAAYEEHAPDVLAAARKTFDATSAAARDPQELLEIDAASFAEVPDISIDYAVMERARNVAVVPGDFD